MIKNDAPVFRIGELNNGIPKLNKEVSRYLAVVPSDRQLEYLKMEYYNFIHFGINTFYNREWGTGKENPIKFNPNHLSTDQWCEALAASGSKGVIITAKHHEGFCLWQTETTAHSIKNSPYKDGKGDIIKELSISAEKYGLKLGIYLSPWDMNASSYGECSYNDFYISQLVELMNGYGELFAVWLDGARDSRDEFYCDYERIYNTIRKLQPNAVICISGPDVRWVGNEKGSTRASEWSVVPEGVANPIKIAKLANKDKDRAIEANELTEKSADLGSRAILSAYDNLIFYPAEVDVSIRAGWFYHKRQETKDLEQLMSIYYRTVGGNCSLLLNVPVNKHGLIPERDRKLLINLGERTRRNKHNKLDYKLKIGRIEAMREKYLVEIKNEDDTSYMMTDRESVIDIQLFKQTLIKLIDIREDLRYSQRIELFDIYIKQEKGYLLLTNGTTVGNRKMVLIDKSTNKKTDGIRIVIKQSRGNPVIKHIGIYE